MSRIQITGSQIRNATITNANIVDATIAEAKLADGAKYLRVDSKRAWTTEQDGGGLKLTNLAVGTNPADAVTYQQLVDNSAGLDPKESVRAATTGPITLSGEQTIDSVAVVAGNRVLVKDQADAKTNGIYVVVDGGAWTRALDLDGSPAAEVSGGNYTFVEAGTLNAGCGYVVVAPGNVTLGTDNVNWTQFSGAGLITAGNGLVKNGNVIDIQLTDGLYFAGAGTDFVGVKLNGTTLTVDGDGLKLTNLAEGKVLIGSALEVATAQTLQGDVSMIADGTVSIGAGRVTNTMLAGAIVPGKLSVTAGKVLIGQTATGKADEMAVTGDVTISESGVTTIGASKVVDSMIASGVTNTKISLTAGKVLIGQTATGKADEMAVTGDVTISESGVTAIGTGKVLNDMLAGSIAAGKLTVASGSVLIGQSGDVAAVKAVTGDVTIDVDGVTTIGATKVLDSMLAGSISAGKLTVAEGSVLIGQTGDVAGVKTVSGDVTITTNGVTAIGTGKVVNAMIADATILSGKLDTAFLKVDGFDWGTASDTTIASTLAIKNYLSNATSFVDEEVPTGSVNGVNVEFTLANAPVATSLKVYLNGQRLKSGAGFDYTLAASVITLAYAPESTDVIVVEYRKAA
jgi:hypothetical protein